MSAPVHLAALPDRGEAGPLVPACHAWGERLELTTALAQVTCSRCRGSEAGQARRLALARFRHHPANSTREPTP